MKRIAFIIMALVCVMSASATEPLYKSGQELACKVQPFSGDTLSLLGYGCMRWPMKDGAVVQDTVNSLVDYAIAHGVNYFDVSPAYLGGKSEPATGIALSRHPRSSYFLADKMSNHHLLKSGIKGDSLYKASIDLYHNSQKYLRTDTFDYYLLHNVGFENRGLSFLKERIFDNNLIAFIQSERRAGRIRNLGFSFHGESREVFDFLINLHDTDSVRWDFVQLKFNYVDFPQAMGVEMSAGEMYHELEKRGIPVIVMEPVRGGKLVNLPDSMAAELKVMEPERSIPSWGFRYAATHPGTMLILSGMTNMNALRDNLHTFSPFVPLTKDEMEMIEQVGRKLVDEGIIK